MKNDISEEVIELEMQETRASLTEKLETLEQKVVGTVENATTAVNETVDAIKETVQETVATVQEGVKDSVDTVKDFLDVPLQVQRRPWLMMGGSVALGYCLGKLLAPSPQASAPTSNGAVTQLRAEGVPPPTVSAPAVSAPAEPSIWAPEVAKLKGLALGVLFGTARELLVSSMPAHISDQVKEIVDNVTRKVGGEPFPSSDWAKFSEAISPQPEQPSSKNP